MCATLVFDLFCASLRFLDLTLRSLLLCVPGLRLSALFFLLLSQPLESALFGEIGIGAAHPDFRTCAGLIGPARRAAHLLMRVVARRAVERWRAAEGEPEPTERQTTKLMSLRNEQAHLTTALPGSKLP